MGLHVCPGHKANPSRFGCPFEDPISGSAPCFQHWFSRGTMPLSLHQLHQMWTLVRSAAPAALALIPVTAPSPQRCPSVSKANYLCSSAQSLCVPKCVSGIDFSWAREASLTAKITTLLPTCCTNYNIYSPCYICELNEVTSSWAMAAPDNTRAAPRCVRKGQ